jgi:G3E family GTPase
LDELIQASGLLWQENEHDLSLATAKEACQRASGMPQQRDAQLHLAGLYHANNQFDESLSLLAEVEADVTDEKDLVPVLHARAEVLETAGKLAEASAELARVRKIRLQASGPESMDAGFAAFNLARGLTLQSQEAVEVPDPRLKARTSRTHSVERILELIQEAESLTLEAHGIALAAGDASQAATFVDDILNLLKADGGGEAVSAATEATTERLSTAYLEATGTKRKRTDDKDRSSLKEGEKAGTEIVGIEKPLPVTVLSGFLGSGKTTLLTHLLNNQSGYRIAIIVNDMASVNVDAELVRRGTTVLEKMVELSNGCICCTLREDLLTALTDLASQKRFDHVIVESSGISEPLPVAETFTFGDEHSGVSLGDLASLHNLVTVVDCAAIFGQLGTMDTLIDRGWQAAEDDDRTVSHLLCEQLEFADVLLVNKTDLLDEAQLNTVEALLRRINPTAEVMPSMYGKIEPELMLGKARFSLKKAEEHTMWLVEARKNEHKPESIEYGISSFVFRARRPFHPERLHAALGSGKGVGALSSLLRVKGIIWLATRNEMQAHAALAGTRFTISPSNVPWWATIPREEWPAGIKDEILELWHEEHGDRQIELVCIGQTLDKVAAEAALRECLLTDEEMAGGEKSWLALPDPFRESWEQQQECPLPHEH